MYQRDKMVKNSSKDSTSIHIEKYQTLCQYDTEMGCDSDASKSKQTPASSISAHRYQATITDGMSSYHTSNDKHQEEELTSKLASGIDSYQFKVLSLLTEIVIIVFAIVLIIICIVVIFSPVVPEFMQSYDIIPETLFFMCIIVALYSFFKWLLCCDSHHIVNSFQSPNCSDQSSNETINSR